MRNSDWGVGNRVPRGQILTWYTDCYNSSVMRINKKLRSVLQITLSLSLLAYLIYLAGPQEVVTTLANIRWEWYLPAFLLFLGNIVLRAYRWYILLHTLNERPSLPHLIYLYFLGFFANNFIPSGFGGDVIKVVSLRQTYGRGAEALSSVLMDRLTGLLGSALLALLALIWNSIGHATSIELPPALWTAVALISIGIPTAFAVMRWMRPLVWLTQRLPIVQRVPKFDKLEELVHTVQRYPLEALGKSLLISLPFTISLIMVQYSTARALDVNLPLPVFSLFVPIIAILNLLPISFNGLGVREGVYKFLFIPIGVAAPVAVAMSLAYYFLRFGAGIVGGIMYGVRSLFVLMNAPRAENL